SSMSSTQFNLGLFFIGFYFRYCKIECCSFSIGGFNPDTAPVETHYLLAMREPDTRTFIFSAGMQTLENDKDPFPVFSGNTDTVVCKTKYIFTIFSDSRYRYFGKHVGFAEFDGVNSK